MTKEFKVYTKTGDDGTTGLVGGSRVNKYDIRLEAYGTIDELNASIGLLRSYPLSSDVATLLVQIQNKLFNIGSILASDNKGKAFTANLAITEAHIKVLEDAIDEFENHLPELTHFILPGGELSVAQCHVARTICRRAERLSIKLAETTPVPDNLIVYLNRLSDYFFMLARFQAKKLNVEQIIWHPKV